MAMFRLHPFQTLALSSEVESREARLSGQSTECRKCAYPAHGGRQRAAFLLQQSQAVLFAGSKGSWWETSTVPATV